jgi:protein-S-isoprenylcysteine O-methyltransferase Ste14
MRLKRHFENWLWLIPMVAVVLWAPPPQRSFKTEVVDTLWDLLGAVLILVGAAVRTCARGWKVERGKVHLVTTGPYSCVRHPLYLGTLLCGLGVCAIHGSLIVFGAFAALFTIAKGLVIFREERQLRARWPEAHAAYRKQVPLLFPSPRGIVRLVRTWPSDLWRAIVKEADSIFVWPVAGVAVRLWEIYGRHAGFRGHRVEAMVLSGLLTSTLAVWLFTKHGARPRRTEPTT